MLNLVIVDVVPTGTREPANVSDAAFLYWASLRSQFGFETSKAM